MSESWARELLAIASAIVSLWPAAVTTTVAAWLWERKSIRLFTDDFRGWPVRLKAACVCSQFGSAELVAEKPTLWSSLRARFHALRSR